MYLWQFFILLYVEAKARAQTTEKEKQEMNTVNSTAVTLPIKYFGEIPIRASNDDKQAYCRNGGIMIGNRCICPYPFTGTRCLDYACGIFHCNDRGEFRNGQCHCIGHFFGSQCQYVSRCDHGKRKHGRCICDEGWEGDYCQDIICQHGYPNADNKSESCVCPARFAGIHCDRCFQKGPKIRPYPECNIDISKSKARIQRQRAEVQFRSRLRITAIASFLLFLLAVTMIFVNRRRISKKKRSVTENLRKHEYGIRKTALEEAARWNKCLTDEQRAELTEEGIHEYGNHKKTNKKRLSIFL